MICTHLLYTKKCTHRWILCGTIYVNFFVVNSANILALLVMSMFEILARLVCIFKNA